jgi:hypothetical protein
MDPVLLSAERKVFRFESLVYLNTAVLLVLRRVRGLKSKTRLNVLTNSSSSNLLVEEDCQNETTQLRVPIISKP